MAEYTFNSSTASCGEWESLLADALDGLLRPEDEAAFNAHRVACPACAALYEEARRGCEWLEFLSAEPDVPAALLDRILANTGPGQVAVDGLAVSNGSVVPIPPVFVSAWQRPGLVSSLRRFAEPRLLTTAAMAFFSLALTLNLTGVRLGNLQQSNLRPSAVRSYMERRLTMASTPIIRYYDHSRLVYELESRVRDLRRTTEGEVQGEGEENRRKQQNSAPGESKQAPGRNLEPANDSARPDSNEFFDSYLTFQDQPVHSGDSREAIDERSTVWTALITKV